MIGGEATIRKELRGLVEKVAASGEQFPKDVLEVLRSDPDQTEAVSADAPTVYGVYFTLSSCSHCRRADHVVKYLQSAAGNLKLRTYLKQDKDTGILQEVVEERCGLPAKKRGLRPFLLIGNRAFTEEMITDGEVMKAVREAEAGSAEPWVVSESERQAAVERLGKLFDSFTLGAMVAGGLLDGINPCAFAVIVFFISYLAALGRVKREMLAIGVSFVLAVFATYLCIGMGLSELLGILTAVPWLGRTLSFGIAGLAFVLAVASFYDMRLAAKGKQREILLQLPSVIKRRINVTLARRVGGANRASEAQGVSSADGRRFALLPVMLAALSSGVIVSFLELACTGQIYLPAVRMMLFESSGRRLVALAYLLVYNLAFIIPLLGIFLLAYMGVTSEQLRGWLNRHISVTKLATGLFFLFLGLLILYIEL
jgi:cytochrome c biogenesis protein CcdA